MKHTLIGGLLCASLCCLQAQQGLSLSEAIRLAQTSNPQLQAARERVRVAQGLRMDAALRPTTRLTLQSENFRAWGPSPIVFGTETDHFLFVSQSFERGGKRTLRTELAETGIQVAEIEHAVLARQIASRVSLAYWSAAAAYHLRDLLRQDIANFEQIVQYHRDRVREGAMAELDLMRVLLERDRLNVSAMAAEQEASRSVIQLLREMGRSTFEPVPIAQALNEVRDLPAPGLDTVISQRPEIEAARRMVAQAKANVTLQQAGARPDPEVLFGYKRTAGFHTLMAGVQIDLPFTNRNQGRIASASAEARAAEFHLAAMEKHVRGEVASAWADYQARRRMLTEVLQPMRERADEIARIALAAYREGGTDLLRLLDAERARIDALTMYYRALSDYQQSVTNLQIVTGAPL